jgi:hypothetical protein
MVEGEKQRFTRRVWILATVACVLLVACAGGLLFYKFDVSHNPIPKDIRQHTSFPLYYPAKLPNGWRVDEHSFQATGDVVTYIIKGSSGNLNVSIQRRPETFDFTTFYDRSLSSTFQFATPIGQAAIGKANGRFIGSLVGDTSWVIISPSNQNVPQADIQSILSHLTRA